MADRSRHRRTATNEDWKHEPLSLLRQRLDVQRNYFTGQWDRIRRGLLPEEMEDKWFIYADGFWLHFHRSWTGFCIYSARFDLQPQQLILAEAWVSREPKHYTATDDEADRDMLYWLIDFYLLGQDTQR